MQWRLDMRVALRSDAADVVSVLAAAELGSRQLAFVDMVLASPHARTFLVEDRGGRPVATALAVAFGTSGWIANVAVVPDLRGRGVGGRVTEGAMRWLTDSGVRGIRLLATDLGRPLYQRLGFRAVGPPYDKYTIAPDLTPRGPCGVRASALQTALGLDQQGTGERRELLLAPFGRDLVEAPGADGAGATGYALRLPWGGGPVVAADPDAAHALWWHVYGEAPGTRWAVSAEHDGARDLAARYGLTPVGASQPMTFGSAPLASGPARVWAAWSLAVG